MYGAIEAGGTKFNVAVGDNKGNVIEKATFKTTTPEEVLESIIDFFKDKDITKMGVGMFGPCDNKKDSITYGSFLNTPKRVWTNFDFYEALKKFKPNVEYIFDTDVNAAGLGEYYLGNGKGLQSLLYITIGTGVGGGFILNGKSFNGLTHPEMGHVIVTPHKDDKFLGLCDYHKYCLEGVASGPTIEARYNKKGFELPKDHEVWEFISDYIAQALVSYTVILRPHQITLGGGVMKAPGLIDKVKHKFLNYFNMYIETPDIDEYIKCPKLGDDSGVVGGLVLAMSEEEKLKIR